MDFVQKALWFVESHSRENIPLEEIARVCDVSAFHLTRSFAETMGISLMRYLRARRLSEAARQLAQGAEDILSLALDAGYGSHEAFTRAFRDQFTLTPGQVRAQGHLNNITLVEAIVMKTQPVHEIEPPRFVTRGPLNLAGLVERYAGDMAGGIPAQWQRFGPYIGNIPGQTGDAAYGVVYNFDQESNFDYMCGVEITGTPDLPRGFQSLRVPSQRYAVFAHKGHIAGIRATCAAIWRDWFPKSDFRAVNGPTLERYGPEFDPTTGLGGLEIWIPVER